MAILVISTSLNPGSKSRRLAQAAAQALADQDADARLIDLRDYKVPICDGDACYGDPAVRQLQSEIDSSRCILLAVPIYNFNVSAAAKNVIELTGQAWEGKIVGFLCAAGGRSSYMSVMGVAASLMLDFRCLIIPRFVYSDRSGFEGENLHADILARVQELASESIRLTGLLAPEV